MNQRPLPPTRQAWKNELQDLIRGAAGGFLFGIPLLYTMEVWWIGSYTEPPLMLLIMAVTFVGVFLLNRTDGFRQINPDDPVQAAMDSIEAMALGYMCVTLTLILLNEVTWETSLDEALGKIILEGVPFAIGVAIARSMLSGSREQAEPAADDSPPSRTSRRRENYNATVSDVGATLIGTVIIAFNVAPTDEIAMLTAASSPPWLLAIIAASLLISYCIVFVAGLTTQQERLQQQGLIQRPLVETVVCYLLSLVAAGLMLWFFHRLSFEDPWTSWLQQTIILGLPATIGGAAGRLAT